jgi:phage portal protein BeeE
VALLRDEVAHHAPMPDPLATYRGMSWLTPVVREIQNDQLMTTHKRKFFENGATPNMVIKGIEARSNEEFLKKVEMIEGSHSGVANAYRTLYMTPGADATVVGRDMKQLDFKVVQGAGETRIAAAAGVPPVIVGLSEGLQGSSLNAGNYGQARRRFADGTMHPLWQNAAGSFEHLVPPPGPAQRLWYDSRDVPFLREDRDAAAKIQQAQAATMRLLVDGAWKPESVVAAVDAEDWGLLEHTGIPTVQVQNVNPPHPADDNDGDADQTDVTDDEA